METCDHAISVKFYAGVVFNLKPLKLPFTVVWRTACKEAEHRGIPLLSHRRFLKIAKLPAVTLQNLARPVPPELHRQDQLEEGRQSVDEQQFFPLSSALHAHTEACHIQSGRMEGKM